MEQIEGHEAIINMINKFREMPILWDSKHPSYHKKDRRRAALAEIATYLQTWVPGCTGEMVKEKMANLRSAHRKIYRQRQEQRSGAAARKSTEPTLWYYKELQFLRDQMEGRPSISSLPSSLPSSRTSRRSHTPAESGEGLADMEPDLRYFTSEEEEEDSSQEVAAPDEAHVSQSEGDSGSQEEAGPSGSQQVTRARLSTTSQVPPLQMRESRLRRSRRLVEEESLAMIRDASALMRAPLNPTEAYSAYIANELNQVGPQESQMARNLINQIFWWIQQGWLTRRTVLSDPDHPAEHLQPPPAAATPSPPARGRGRARGSSAARQPGRKALGKRRR